MAKITTWSSLATAGVIAAAWPAAATAHLDGASGALAFWMTWGLVYLAIGAALMGVATAAGVRERRAWSSMLSWADDDEWSSPPEDGDEANDASARAA
jgi:hypothetical protein